MFKFRKEKKEVKSRGMFEGVRFDNGSSTFKIMNYNPVEKNYEIRHAIGNTDYVIIHTTNNSIQKNIDDGRWKIINIKQETLVKI